MDGGNIAHRGRVTQSINGNWDLLSVGNDSLLVVAGEHRRSRDNPEASRRFHCVHDGTEIVSGSDVNICSGCAVSHGLQNVPEIYQTGRINNPSHSRARTGGDTREWNRNRGISGKASYLPVVFQKPVDPEFLIVVQSQLANHCAERHLWRFYIHLVENFGYLDHNLAVPEYDDGIRALIGNDLGISDSDRLGGGINRLSR